MTTGAEVDRMVARWVAEIRHDQRHNHLLRMPEDMPAVTFDLARDEVADGLLALVEGRVSELDLGPLGVDQAGLDRVEAVSRRLRSERGVDGVRLGLGVITHPDLAGGVCAPLLLLDAQLVRHGRFRDVQLVVRGAVEINPVLVALSLADGWGPADLPGASRSLTDLMDRAAQEAVPPDVRRGASIRHQALLGVFSSPRMATLAEMDAPPECYRDSLVLRAIAGDAAAIDDVNTPRSRGDDEQRPRARLVLPLRADSSQVRAIDGATGRVATCIEGPPGTGKSQTIANLIASSVADGKRVLLVCEKRAGVDAVVRRLTAGGCGGVISDLHSTGRATWEVARDLVERLERIPPTSSDLGLGVEHQGQVEDMVSTFHALVPELGCSAFDVHQALARARRGGAGVPVPTDEIVALIDARVRTIDPRDARIADALRELVRVDWRALTDANLLVRWLVERNGLATDARADELTRLLPWASAAARRASDAALAGAGPTGSIGELIAAAPAWAALAATSSAWSDVVLDDPHLLDPLLGGGPLLRWRASVDATTRASVDALRPHHRDGTASASSLRADARHLHRALAETGVRAPVPRATAGATSEALGTLVDVIEALDPFLPSAELRGESIQDLAESLRALVDDPRLVSRAASAGRALDVLRTAGLGAATPLFVLAAETHGEGAGQVVLEASVAEARRRQLTALRPDLTRFDDAAFLAAVEQTAAGEARLREVAAHGVTRAVHAARMTSRSWGGSLQALQTIGRDRSRHLPLRLLFGDAAEAVLLAAPCVTLSPSQVPEVLPARVLFDLVVFDEASQVRTRDAAPAIARGRSVVAVGDDRQLPPTTFFDADVDNGELIGADLLESVLDSIAAVTVSSTARHRLTWHYRSRDPRLIDFSNGSDALYRGTLFVPPTRTPESDVLHHVLIGPDDDDSVLVDLVVDHVRRHPGESAMAVVTSLAAAERLDALVRARMAEIDDGTLAHHLDLDGDEPLVVKNIERVQGDERDGVIFLLRAVRGRAGTVVHNFGSLSQAGGERRLNVAITRARRRMTVVTDMSADAIDRSRLTTVGSRTVADYLEWIERSAVASSVPVPLQDPLLLPLDDALRPAGLHLAGLPETGAHGASAVVIGRDGTPVMLLDHNRPDLADLDGVDLSVVRPTVFTDRGWATAMVWSSDLLDRPQVVAADIVATIDGRPS